MLERSWTRLHTLMSRRALRPVRLPGVSIRSIATAQALRPWGRPIVDAWRRTLDALLPRQCALCDDWLVAEEQGLCAGCLDALPGRDAPRCRRCALRLGEMGFEGATALRRYPGPPQTGPTRPTTSACCPGCEGAADALSRTIALCDYAPPIDRALVAGKFHGQTTLLHRFGEALAATLVAGPIGDPVPLADLVVPIPLSDQRLTERGYNQAGILARVLGRRLSLPCHARALRRTRHTASQSALNRMDREANLRDAFACRIDLSGRTVALIDDVMTTGATLQAGAACLRRAGAVEVIGLVIARTPAPRVPAPTA